MKHLITIICLMFIASFAYASEPSGKIEVVENTYRSLNDLSADFTQTTEIALVEKIIAKKGKFSFKKGGKLRIEYKGKDEKNYISDGHLLWTFIPGDAESLQTFTVDDKTVPKEALSFLNGFGKLSKEFSVSDSTSFKDASEGTIALRLVPKKKAKHYEYLDALFGKDGLLLELIVKNTSGNTSHYKFTGIKTNTGLADNLFTLSQGKATPDTLPR